MKAYGFTMKRGNVTIETFVYSEHGKDIENRFPEWKVTDIKEIPVQCHKITQAKIKKKLTMTANNVSITKGNRKAI